MSLFRFGNLERELDFTDADFLDRLDYAYEKIQEDVKALPKEGKNSDLVRAQNACYDTFFDNILGEGASREMFDTNSLSRRIDAAEALAEFRQAEITALVGLNDMIAYGILDAMNEAGKKIPLDFSVCGCDNDFPSDLAGVSLTSVEHFMVKNAHLAFQILHSKMTGRDGTQNALIRMDIQPELIRRTSTGPLKIQIH